MNQNTPPPRKPNFPPMTDDEMLEQEAERSGNKMHVNASNLSVLTSQALTSLQGEREKLPLVNGDLNEIKEQAFRYIKACETAGTIPTIQGLSRSLGHSRTSVYQFLDIYPNTPIAEFIEQVRDCFSEILDLAGLNNKVNPVYAIFCQKSLFGRIDKAELYINPPPNPNPLGETLSIEEIRKKYLAVPLDDDE